MNLKEWWKWFKDLHVSRKWYVILILIRPIIDNFWELKEASALASPLYIVGALTPVFIGMSLLSHKFPQKPYAVEDNPFRFFAIMLAFNAIIFWFIQVTVVAFGDLIKYLTPILIFVYARHFVQSKKDLHGILTTFLISCIFPFGVLAYESIFNPIAVEFISQGRGGGSRIRGAYADIMNYAIYLMGFMLCIGYYFLNGIYNPKPGRSKINATHLVLSLMFILYGLSRIRHVSTWGVAIALLGLLLVHNLKNTRGALFVIVFGLVVATFFAQDIYTDNIQPLIEKELKVADGESDVDQAFNGRMNRWERYFEIWEQMPALNHFTGIVSANFKETIVMIGGGMHSDYVRLLFLTGFIGLFFYLIFLFSVLAKWTLLQMPEKFILSGAVGAIMLWSISTVPTLYAPLLYLIYPIFAYALLPKSRYYLETE
ncbi:hypothetical protein BH11BAC2_BH11BAC2_07310 [soil metagenome]